MNINNNNNNNSGVPGFIVCQRHYETRNTGGTLVPGTPKHWRINGRLAKQTEYHRMVEHEKSSGITEQQNSTKKYYQYRTMAYWADKIKKL